MLLFDSQITKIKINAATAGSMIVYVLNISCKSYSTCMSYFSSNSFANLSRFSVLTNFTQSFSASKDQYNISRTGIFRQGTVLLIQILSGRIYLENKGANKDFSFIYSNVSGEYSLGFINSSTTNWRFCIALEFAKYSYTLTNKQTWQYWFYTAGVYDIIATMTSIIDMKTFVFINKTFQVTVTSRKSKNFKR